MAARALTDAARPRAAPLSAGNACPQVGAAAPLSAAGPQVAAAASATPAHWPEGGGVGTAPLTPAFENANVHDASAAAQARPWGKWQLQSKGFTWQIWKHLTHPELKVSLKAQITDGARRKALCLALKKHVDPAAEKARLEKDADYQQKKRKVARADDAAKERERATFRFLRMLGRTSETELTWSARSRLPALGIDTRGLSRDECVMRMNAWLEARQAEKAELKAAIDQFEETTLGPEIYAKVMSLIGVWRELPVHIFIWELRHGQWPLRQWLSAHGERQLLLLLGGKLRTSVEFRDANPDMWAKYKRFREIKKELTKDY